MYASATIAKYVTLVHKSTAAERLWMILHTERGPFLLGAWYRPPAHEHDSIHSCSAEHRLLREGVMGTLLLGDLNVHHESWLKFSSKTQAEAETLRQVTAEIGLTQRVKKPTRGKYLLDLALSDMDGIQVDVLPKIADSKLQIG